MLPFDDPSIIRAFCSTLRAARERLMHHRPATTESRSRERAAVVIMEMVLVDLTRMERTGKP
jgi:hypothetical protein